MKHHEQILEYALEHWHNNFTGISAISLAENLQLAHKEVLKVFDDFETSNKGTLRRNEKLYTVSFSIDKLTFKNETQEVITSIFFPSKALLQEYFYQQNLHRENLPEYIIRLHKGYSQIHSLYFRSSVLKKYFDNQEKYNVTDSVSGGYIDPNYDYIQQFSDEEYDKIAFGQIRFGKRDLVSGDIAVTTILHDLSELPDSEQRHWHSHEIENPQFSNSDSDFINYYRRNFLADWVEYNDPLEKCLDELVRTNGLFNGAKLFAREQNPYLSYPVLNTHKDFCDSCSELYKLIGPDNLKKKRLQKILSDYFNCLPVDFIHESERPLSQIQLLELVTQKLGETGLISAINEVKSHRISADHKILSPKLNDVNYMVEFRKICSNLHQHLNSFANELEKTIQSHPTPR